MLTVWACLAMLLVPPTRIVPSGDSITLGYGESRLATVLAAQDPNTVVIPVAQSGATTGRYLGLEPNPVTGVFLDLVEIVKIRDPDIILMMFGTNDAMQSVADPNGVQRFDQNLRTMIDRYQAWQNRRGNTPVILLSTVIPITDPNLPFAAGLVDAEINPRIRQIATAYELPLIDLNAQMQQQPDWEDWYGDGIHLWADNAAGYWWMAERFASTIPALSSFDGCPCPGDLDCSGEIDLPDLAILLSGFGGTTGDVTFDDQTNLSDLALMLSRFGKLCD